MAMSGAPTGAEEMRTLVGLGARGRAARARATARASGTRRSRTGAAPSALIGGADTVMFCLSKGLGAPVGSLLCGPTDVIAEAREQRQRLGGGMRQAGMIAAAGIVALETMVERLADDHARARRIADALADRWPGSVDPATVRTNIVCARLEQLPDDFIARLAAAGVRGGTIDPRTVRFVTHKDVDDDDVARVIAAFDGLRRGLTWWSTTTSRNACSRSTRIPTIPRSRRAATLARWADAGTEVHVLITTRGDKGSDDPDIDTDALAQLRVEETAAAARVLGVTPHHLDHPDGELNDDRALRLELVRSVRVGAARRRVLSRSDCRVLR